MSSPPDWAIPLLQRGFRALNAGQLQAAGAQVRHILERDSRVAQAHFLLGLVALAGEDRRTAINAFGSVTRLDGQHHAAWAQLARLFLLAGQVTRAEQALQRASEGEQQAAVVCDVIGTVYSQMGDQTAAALWYQRAVTQQPDHVGFQVNLASAELFLGKSAVAIDRLQTLTTRSTNAQAHWLLAGARKAQNRTHVETIVRLIGRGGHATQDLAFYFYALGKLLEDLGEWSRAFEAFRQGAGARRHQLNYDEAAEESAFARLHATYTTEWLASQPFGAEGERPLFIVGLPRTGTTLVERIITSHPQAVSAGELQQFALSVRRVIGEPIEGRFPATLFERAANIDLRAVGESYLKATSRYQQAGCYFVDKLPSNYLFIPLILAALPQARIVHLVRDARDACFASFKQLFADAYPHSYDQEEMARHYVRYHNLMAVWRERFPGRFLDVSYEQVVADLEGESRRLLDFLELPWNPAVLEFHARGDAVSTASAVQVREPAHTRSVGRWRRYAAELAPMDRILREAGL